MNPLLEQYLQEARENLKFVEQNLEDLGSGDAELMNSIFRAVHTIKGGSGIVEFDAIRNITHSAEDLLDMLRSNKLEFRDSMTDVLFDAFDEVLNLIEAAEETGDIVEADEDTVNRIVTELKEQMGKADEVIVWKPPFHYPENNSSIVEKDFRLDFIEETIPFELDPITEKNFKDRRLYAVCFDVDESCMVFGNDPVYAMGLLGSNLISIYNCFDTNTAKELIAGFEDNDDDLLLRSKIIGFIHATFDEMEEGIYNFLDDCYVLPLDVKTLLNVSFDGVEDIDLVKDLVESITNSLNKGDIDSINSSINEALGLINKNSRLAFLLKRLQLVIKILDMEEYDKLTPFMSALLGKDIVIKSNDSTPIQVAQSVEVPEEEVETQESVVKVPSNVELTKVDKVVIEDMLVQQYEQLSQIQDEMMVERVKVITQRCASLLGKECKAKSANDMLAWIKSVVGEKVGAVSTQSAPQTQAKPVESKPVEVQKTEPKVEQKAVVQKQEPKVEIVTNDDHEERTTPNKLVKKDEKKDVIGKVVKIEQESIDSLMSIVGELLVAKNSLPYLAGGVHEMDKSQIKRSILEKYSFINRLSTQLQDLIIGMRMLPISYVFDRYPKLVRDISKKLNKKVKLVQEGADTKLDKNIIEMLADPLIHIARNSLDHGLETEDERLENGKDGTGTLLMKAYPESDKVIIEIVDDGRGINVDRVSQKILEKGLMSAEQIDKLSYKEKSQLVMLPGLSTAETITEFSGRGVGMDVVKKSVESFGGSIDITTTQGEGTKIVLSIPMSLAVSTLLQVSMNGNTYGFPMDIVSETVKIDSSEITYLNNEPYIYIRGQVVPLLYIDAMLEKDTMKKKILSIVIIMVKGNQLAVIVNELIGQIDVVQKPLDGILENHPLFSGAALLGNGQIIIIFDSIGLLDMQVNSKG